MQYHSWNTWCRIIIYPVIHDNMDKTSVDSLKLLQLLVDLVLSCICSCVFGRCNCLFMWTADKYSRE